MYETLTQAQHTWTKAMWLSFFSTCQELNDRFHQWLLNSIHLWISWMGWCSFVVGFIGIRNLGFWEIVLDCFICHAIYLCTSPSMIFLMTRYKWKMTRSVIRLTLCESPAVSILVSFLSYWILGPECWFHPSMIDRIFFVCLKGRHRYYTLP